MSHNRCMLLYCHYVQTLGLKQGIHVAKDAFLKEVFCSRELPNSHCSHAGEQSHGQSHSEVFSEPALQRGGGKDRCRHPEAQRDSSAEGELRLIPEEWSLGNSVTTWNRD